jgi:hypothetical protein
VHDRPSDALRPLPAKSRTAGPPGCRFFCAKLTLGLDRVVWLSKEARMINSALTKTEPVRLADTPGALAGLLEVAQRAAFSGPQKLKCVSLAMDVGPLAQPGEAVTTDAAIDRATRSLLFVQSRVLRHGDGVVLATGSGVYQIVTP